MNSNELPAYKGVWENQLISLLGDRCPSGLLAKKSRQTAANTQMIEIMPLEVVRPPWAID